MFSSHKLLENIARPRRTYFSPWTFTNSSVAQIYIDSTPRAHVIPFIHPRPAGLSLRKKRSTNPHAAGERSLAAFEFFTRDWLYLQPEKRMRSRSIAYILMERNLYTAVSALRVEPQKRTNFHALGPLKHVQKFLFRARPPRFPEYRYRYSKGLAAPVTKPYCLQMLSKSKLIKFQLPADIPLSLEIRFD